MPSHASLTGAQLHEPKGVAAASASTVYVADGAGSGAWSAVPSAALPSGALVNSSRSQTSTVQYGVDLINYDNTIPQSSEGQQFMTLSHTPLSSSNRLVIRVILYVSPTNTPTVVTALFKDSDANALSCNIKYHSTGSNTPSNPAFIEYHMTAGTTSAITFKVRSGPDAADTITINGESGAAKLGGTVYSSIEVLEYKA